jgi:hypothetical protein
MKNRERRGGEIKTCKERGEWAEIYFVMLAMERNMKVSKPYGESKYDVGVEGRERIVRVQVKSTIYKRRGECYSINLMGPKRKKYAPGTVDFFAILLIPLDKWYVIPFEVLGRKHCSAHCTPSSKRQKYGKYKEAWELLRGETKDRGDKGMGNPMREERRRIAAAGTKMRPERVSRNSIATAMNVALGFLITLAMLGVTSAQSVAQSVTAGGAFPQRINAVQAPQPTGTNSAAYLAVLAQNNMLLSGQTLVVGLGNSGGSALYLDTETGTGACAPTVSFTALDAVVTSYPTNLLLAPATEGGTNTWTPACVWSQAQADASYLPYAQNKAYLPGEYIFQSGNYWQLQTGCWSGSGYDNTCTTGATAASFAGSGPVSDGAVVWVKIGAHAVLQDGYCGGSYQCGGSSANCYTANGSNSIVINGGSLGPCSGAELYESEPIPSELPVRNWMEQVVAAAIAHYNGKVGYVRVGSPAGGELSPIGIGSGLWPNYGSSAGQQRAQYLSWVKDLDKFVASAGPTMNVDTDMNCAGNPADCAYADQEAQLAHDNNFNMLGTNGYQVNDVLNLEGQGTNNCGFPLTMGSGCTSGDWAYNCSRFTTNLAGNPMGCLLQTLTGTTVIDCAAGLTGPLAPLPAGSTYCATGFPGLLPFLVSLCKAGIGNPGQKVCVQTMEIYTNGPASGSSPTYSAGDILLALDMTYTTTTYGVAAYAPYQLPYASALGQFLGASSVYGGGAGSGGTGADQVSVMGGAPH